MGWLRVDGMGGWLGESGGGGGRGGAVDCGGRSGVLFSPSVLLCLLCLYGCLFPGVQILLFFYLQHMLPCF